MSAARVAAVVLTGLVGAAFAMAAVAPAASASAVPLEIDLGLLLPGEVRTIERPVVVDRDAHVATASFATVSGSASWDAALCRADDCVAIDELADRDIARGDYVLEVSVTMAEAAQGEVFAADGSIVLAEETPLALTGSTAPWTALVAGVSLALAGGVLVAVRRRRAAEESA